MPADVYWGWRAPPLSLGFPTLAKGTGSMSGQFAALQQQLDLYQKQSAQADAWKGAHQEAMACRDIEDAITFGLGILYSIQRRNGQWASEVRSGAVQFSWEIAQHFADLYQSWLGFSRHLLQAIDACEQGNYEIDGTNTFRSRVREVALMNFDLDRIRRSISALQQGKGAPFRQVVHELRNRLGGGSAPAGA